MPQTPTEVSVPKRPVKLSPPPLWRNVSFSLMWTSTAASGFGERMIMMAALALLGGLAQGIDSRSSIQAGTQFWFFLAYIPLSIPAGMLADRMPRKIIMFLCDEFRGSLLILAVFMLAAATGPVAIPGDHHWKIYLILFGVGIFAATFNPARNAIVPQIVGPHQLQGANGIILGINVIASLAGAIIAALIIDPQSAQTVQFGLFLGAAFYIVSGFFFLFLKPMPKPAYAQNTNALANYPLRSRMRGLAYIKGHRRLIWLMIYLVVIWSAAAAVASSLIGLGSVFYDLYGQDVNIYFASMSATLGAGMLAGAILIGLRGPRREAMFTIGFGMASAGLSVLGLATIPWMPAGYVFAFGIGVFGNFGIVATMSLLQRLTPDFIRGRVMGLTAISNTFFSVLVYFTIWQLPNSDTTMVITLMILGPAIFLLGLFILYRYMTQGPMATKMLNFCWRLFRTYNLTWHRVQWIDRHNVPADGPVILTPNHTCGIDPFLINTGMNRLVRWVMTAPYRFKFAEPMWKAIDPIVLEHDSQSTTQIRQMLNRLKDNEVVGIFPEGGLQRDVRELQPFKPGVGMLARKSQAAVVPVWISGTPTRKHMFWHFATPSRSTVRFGKPYYPDRSQSNEEIVNDLRERMASLAAESGDDEGASFRGKTV